ncbi:uncharacterized protein LOC141854454 [Brevipalpus obovatus]|uniref:uncharacterized protein LOC141854454 n=1 Tax=Brevipalpus obovatus TaxID=246614 RepID=UPI003D9F1B34
MIKIAILSMLAVSVYGQQFAPQNSPSSSLTTPAPFHPPAQVHYVNIGQDLAGDYKFGYDTGKGPNGQSFREETRLPDGTVKGAYGYIDANGEQRIVRYTAGKAGFQIDSDAPASAAPKSNANPPRPAPQPAPQFQSFPQAIPRPQPAPVQAPPPQAQSFPQAFPQPNPAFQGSNQAFAANAGVQYRPTQIPAAPQASPAAALNNPALQYLRYVSPQAAAQPQHAGHSGISAHNLAALRAVNQPQSQPQPQPQPQPAPQNFPAFQPRSIQSNPNQAQGTPLSAFPQLPGVRLIQINPRPQPASQPSFTANANTANFASNSFANSNSYGGVSTTTPEPEYTGPVVINAALLSYDIGSANRQG